MEDVGVRVGVIRATCDRLTVPGCRVSWDRHAQKGVRGMHDVTKRCELWILGNLRRKLTLVSSQIVYIPHFFNS